MSSQEEIFGQPLQPDPSVALPKPKIEPALLKQGPLHRLHFVVEIVGQRTLPAPQAKVLLDPTWQGPLGQPKVFVMAPADETWRPLAPNDASAAYDSVALGWPYISDRGSLSQQAAQNLLKASEHFAQQVQRRAMSVPTPEDVPKVVRQLGEARDNLDVGVSLTAEARSGISERSIWIACAQLGLDFGGSGVFEYRTPGWESSLVDVYPLEAQAFSLGAVQRGESHPGVGVGFSVPRSPDPMMSLEAALRIAGHFEKSFGCVVYDDSENALTDGAKKGLRDGVAQAVWALNQFGMRPGSVEARQLFSE